MKQEHADLYRLTQFMMTNYYILNASGGVAVIDTGYDDRVVPQLRQALGKLGRGLEDVRWILITHEHPDHIGGLPALNRAIPHAKVVAHAAAVPYIQGEKPINSAGRDELSGLDVLIYDRMIAASPSLEGVPVTRPVADGETLDDIYPGLQVIHLPGHADGQVGYWLANERVLIAGDVVGNYPLIGLQKPLRPAAPDWDAVPGAILKAANLKPRLLLPGHILPCRDHVAAGLRGVVAR